MLEYKTLYLSVSYEFTGRPSDLQFYLPETAHDFTNTVK